ncbi:hypothetical protein F2Q70_00015034 [Brassica cretica]|uniref:Uncharacterized protein n=1 Tax=Brassica cretica TaxID=69181 RepID=A0A8S9HQ82_BRACR|nr:hypothetical protein F2Q70_00015034 [Brassica cretica]
MLTFMNILKKFDKITGKQILPIYLKVVESSYFNSSDKIGVYFNTIPITLGLGIKINNEDSKLRTVSGRVFSCQGKNLKIKIPLTNPSRTFSAISYLIKEDLINQSSSKKCGPDGVKKLRISKKKLSHAEKMIKGALTELYKG